VECIAENPDYPETHEELLAKYLRLH